MENLKSYDEWNAQEYLRFCCSKAEGGIMDLGGMEKDYREGGFVPIGRGESDDVPARLSKNLYLQQTL